MLQVREGSPNAGNPINQGLMLPGQQERIQAVSASSKFLKPVGTHWVEHDVLSVAEEVNRRWPNLRIASCSCGHCLARDHYPHVVMEHCKDGVTRPVFGFTRLGRDVIDRLGAIHESQNPQARHAALNARRRREEQARAEEQRREDLEVVEAALRSGKHNWKGPRGMRTNPHAKAI